jgi:epidermal growth factor receptor substrate 15
MDDLLGDNDPEVSKKLTQETTELANMSNQIGTLRTQMQEVQSKKTTTESDINSASTQKRDLELRLSQFRSQYEQEVKAVKALEDRLTTSRNETRKLQQEYAMIEGTYQDLQNQHRQVATALDADQRENANLKERIRQINAEVGQLRPQLEKMRTDARKEKGMVSINKKQLSTNEGERDKIKSEMNDLTKAAQEAYRSPQPTPQEQGSNVVSPAASTASHNTNPFFRKSPQPTTDNAMSPSGFTRTQSQPSKDFDNVFGPSFTSSPSTAAPPQTSFRQDSQSNVPTFSAPSGHSVRSSEGPDVPTPSTSPPLSSYQESPRGGEPPAPPESRQFASSFLPLREGVPRSDSFSSSVKVSAPASRYGGPTGNETPTIAGGSPSATPVQDKGLEKTDTAKTETTSFGQSLFQDRNFTASPAASATSEGARSGPKTEDRKDTYQNFGQPSVHRDIPGAFPGDTNSPIKPDQTGESTLSDRSKNSNQNFPAARSDPFATSREQPKGPVAAKDAFDAAFAGFGPSRQMHQEKQHTGSSINGSVDSQSANKFNQEFPPIEDIGGEEDSDSNSETGFADNFTSASPQQNRQSHGQSSTQSRPSTSTTGPDAAVSDFFAAAARPSVTQQDTNNSVLPTPGAQKSPPTYDQTMAPARSGTRDSNQFPPEFGGLLPARQDPTSPPQPSQSPEKSFNTSSAGGQGGALFGGGSTSKATSAPATAFSSSPPPADTPVSTVPSDAYHSAVSNPSGEYKGPSPIAHPPQISKPTYSDDFDSGFDDLSEAKEADDKTDDDFMLGSHHRDGLDEFNPVFDSPAASKSNTMASQQTPTGKPGHSGENSFSDFEHMSQSFSQPQAPQQPQAKPSQDWDAIFSSLDAPPAEKATAGQGEQGKSAFDKFGADEPSGSANKQQMPQLGRALSAGTEHDDPILKKLTGMGYPREQALAALEKFDYDINMVLLHLKSSD